MAIKSSITRRNFLQHTLTTAAGFSIVPRHVLGGNGVLAPSEELTCGIIGVGGMGAQHLQHYTGARLLAICDVDATHRNQALQLAAQAGKKDVAAYADWRELIERPDIDIVHIVTPPHWHALMAVAAAAAGKDVWCEKPMTRTIGEGEKVVAAMARHGRMFRINTWWRFRDPFFEVGTDARTLHKIVNSGEFGWPLKFVIGKSTGFDWKFYFGTGATHLPPQPVPAHLDYDMWLGPAPEKPYHPDRVHFKFRGYWDYDGGGLCDMGQHHIDPIQMILGKDNESPVEIEAEGPEQHPDAVQPWRTVRIRYADGCEIILDGTNEVREVPFMEGPKGKLFTNLRSTIPDFEKKLATMKEPPPHENTDFYDCVRRRVPFALNERNGHRSCTVVNLSKIAVRTGRVLHFDPAKQRFINDDAANAMIEEPMRAPWRLT